MQNLLAVLSETDKLKMTPSAVKQPALAEQPFCSLL